MYDVDKIIEVLIENNIIFKKNVSMSEYTSFKIGGNADIFVDINKKEELQNILKIARKNNAPFFILGKGSNILVSDEGYRGIVIKLGGDFLKIEFKKNNILKCGAGVSLAKLCREALKNSKSGLEFFWGIPGTIGGAVYMNAGAYGGEIKDVIISCEHINNDGEFKILLPDDLNFSYRKSVYSDNNYIITNVTIKLKNDAYNVIKSRMNDFIFRRKSKQPLEYPSAGSIFKRPHGNFAGALIEQCGLKGKSIGGAMVSLKHAGFIVNTGNATCRDVIYLIEFIKENVYKKTGVLLECEIKKLECR